MWTLFLATYLSTLVLGSHCQSLHTPGHLEDDLGPRSKRHVPILHSMLGKRELNADYDLKRGWYDSPLLHGILKGKRGQVYRELPILHQLLGKRDHVMTSGETLTGNEALTSHRLARRGRSMYLYSYPLLHMLPGRKRYPSYPGHLYPILHGVPRRPHFKRATDNFSYGTGSADERGVPDDVWRLLEEQAGGGQGGGRGRRSAYQAPLLHTYMLGKRAPPPGQAQDRAKPQRAISRPDDVINNVTDDVIDDVGGLAGMTSVDSTNQELPDAGAPSLRIQDPPLNEY